MRMTVAIVSLVLLAPRTLWACPVCGLIGVEEGGSAYLVMTLVLSALPLLMIGGVVTWLYRRVSSEEAAADSQGRAHLR